MWDTAIRSTAAQNPTVVDTDASQTHGPAVIATGAVFLSIAWVLALLRFYVRAFMTKSWGWDDTFLAVAQLTYTVECIAILIGVHWGIGTHADHIPAGHLPIAYKCWWMLEVFFTATSSLVRVSIVLMLYRVCRSQWHTRMLHITMAAYSIYSIFFFLLVVLQCNPVSHFWEQFGGQSGSCLQPHIVPDASIALGALSAAVDIVLAVLPLMLINELQLDKQAKISLLFIVALACLDALVAVIRVVGLKSFYSFQPDFMYSTYIVVVWHMVEPGVAIFACALAALRPLFKKFSSNHSAANAQYGNNNARTRKPEFSQSAAYFGNFGPGERLPGSQHHFDKDLDIEAHELTSTPSSPSMDKDDRALVNNKTTSSARRTDTMAIHLEDGIIITRTFEVSEYDAYQGKRSRSQRGGD